MEVVLSYDLLQRRKVGRQIIRRACCKSLAFMAGRTAESEPTGMSPLNHTYKS